MTEKEMRSLLRAYCERLDAERLERSPASRLRQTLGTAAIGMGALTCGCAKEPIPQPYLAIPADAQQDAGAPEQRTTGVTESMPQPYLAIYQGPDAKAGVDRGRAVTRSDPSSPPAASNEPSKRFKPPGSER